MKEEVAKKCAESPTWQEVVMWIALMLMFAFVMWVVFKD